MKRSLNFSKEELNSKKHQRILNNYYTKQMKKGKTYRAVILDKIALSIGVFILLLVLLNRLIGRFFIGLIISVCLSIIIGIYSTRIGLKLRDKRINEFKKEHKLKLEEEKLLSPEDDLEEYLINNYYEKKHELRSNFKLFNRDKIFKFYMLSLVFFAISYFVSYSLYYKVMAIIAFITATVIGSYNLTEYIRKKDTGDLLNRDIDV